MEKQEIKGVNFYMIAWQILDDELVIAHSQMEEEDKAALRKR